MLVPVSGIIQVGSQARADRYTYLPQVGLFLAIIWTFANIAGSSRRNAVTLTGLVTVFLVAYVYVTRQQIPVWHDTVSLWQRVSKCQPNELYVAQNLIKSLINNGNKPEAIRLTQAELLATNDSDCEKIVMLAMLLAVEGEHAACAEALGKAIQHFPQKAELYSNRGKAFAAMGKWHDAADDYRQASKQAPNSASFQFYLAHALGKIGQTEDARRIFSEAVRRSPRWPQNAARDAWRMSTSPDFRERMDFWPVCLAEQAIEAAGEESPQYLDILAAAYAHSGRFDDAIATAQRAIQQADRTRQNTFAELIRKRLELYERHLPYREPGKGTNPTS
jgi:tetratricopeptide (TPR) repeat protein